LRLLQKIREVASPIQKGKTVQEHYQKVGEKRGENCHQCKRNRKTRTDHAEKKNLINRLRKTKAKNPTAERRIKKSGTCNGGGMERCIGAGRKA